MNFKRDLVLSYLLFRGLVQYAFETLIFLFRDTHKKSISGKLGDFNIYSDVWANILWDILDEVDQEYSLKKWINI